jgi:hypothetical protein
MTGWTSETHGNGGKDKKEMTGWRGEGTDRNGRMDGTQKKRKE